MRDAVAISRCNKSKANLDIWDWSFVAQMSAGGAKLLATNLSEHTFINSACVKRAPQVRDNCKDIDRRCMSDQWWIKFVLLSLDTGQRGLVFTSRRDVLFRKDLTVWMSWKGLEWVDFRPSYIDILYTKMSLRPSPTLGGWSRTSIAEYADVDARHADVSLATLLCLRNTSNAL